MVFNRLTAKVNARISIKNANPKPILVTLVYMLLTVFLSNLIFTFASNNLEEALYYLQSGYDPAEVFNYVFVQNSGKSAVFSVVSILFQAFNAVMSVGYAFYALHVGRNVQSGYKDLFFGFTLLFRSIWLYFLMSLFAGLWTALFMIPSLVALFAGIAMESSIMVLLYPILLTAAIVGGVYMALRYAMAVFIMLDEGCKAREAIRRSKAMMKGHVTELFILELTFIGWWLLSAITFGIVGLWVTPYTQVTLVNFYDAVRRPTDPDSIPYTGQVYNFGPGDNQGPEL